jgi:3-oxoacyl-(acyl-carrier-protein) synthase
MSTNIVITGEGIISAIGLDKQQTLQSLQEGKSGIGEMHHLASSHHELPVGEVKLSDEEMKRQLALPIEDPISRTTLLGIIAVKQALIDAHLTLDNQTSKRIVLISGTTVGGMDMTERHFEEMVERGEKVELLLQHDGGSCTERIARHFGIFSESATISTACSSAANALILGANLLKSGQADIVVAGGTEALTRFHLNGFNSLMILDHERCRPFDANRAGLNLGEGAAYVVMETEEMARQRQADIHAWLTGYGNACDAFHQTASSDNGEGAYLAMTEALTMAGLSPSDIDYVNAHGTGTPNNDVSESFALQRVFANELPPISSTKSMTGHATSASGSIETVICLLAMQHGFIPANVGWQQPMIDGITPSMGKTGCVLHHVMCNSFGFGGNDSSLVLSKDGGVEEDIKREVKEDIKEVARVEITSEEQLADIRNYVKPLEARRMGKIMKSSLLSSLQALEQAGITKPDAIITATALGCLENSEALLYQMKDEGEVMLKPTNFMQSTHNTIGSNIAIRLKCHGYNMTYTHGKQSLDWALRDAHLLLETGKAKSVLVGLHDESTPLYRALMDKMGVHDLPNIHSIAIVLTCGK